MRKGVQLFEATGMKRRIKGRSKPDYVGCKTCAGVGKTPRCLFVRSYKRGVRGGKEVAGCMLRMNARRNDDVCWEASRLSDDYLLIVSASCAYS